MQLYTLAEKEIIEAYKNGQSMNSIAKIFNTHATTIKRLLEKNEVELRHDTKKIGQVYVKGGEKLIEWAKAQGRLVTRNELAKVIGKRKLSPSYFIKYPELGKYIKPYDQNELSEYFQKLYNWLNKNKIPYKPNDRTKLKVAVDALLLEEYEGIALQISEKSKYISKKRHKETMDLKIKRAKEAGIKIIFLDKTYFEDLNKLKVLLNDLKN